MKFRISVIGMCVILMLGAVYIVGTTLSEEGKWMAPTALTDNPTASIPVERGVFSRSEYAMSYQDMPESDRGLDTYYENRAYPGAPPTIPHPLISEKGIGGKTCLQCHQNGGYVKQFEAFAPVTPHPELLNCKQCHVPQKTTASFRASHWEKIAASDIHQVAMPGAPPVIPHTLEMRNNCLSCHAGPAAPKEIRVSHPERINCRQCHVPKTLPEIFTKPERSSSTFERPNKTIEWSSEPLGEKEVDQISEWLRNEKQ